jgi:hypothetical protein
MHQNRPMKFCRLLILVSFLPVAAATPTLAQKVHVAYYTADQSNLRLVLSDLEYTYGRDSSLGSYWEGGVGTRNLEDFSFDEGTLAIDALDAREKKLIWRGIGTAAMARKKPDKNEAKLDRALQKIMKRWDEMYGAKVRAIRKHQMEQDD